MKTQPKLDLYKLNKTEYAATRKPALVELKPATYLAISGQGAPGGEKFTASMALALLVEPPPLVTTTE